MLTWHIMRPEYLHVHVDYKLHDILSSYDQHDYVTLFAGFSTPTLASHMMSKTTRKPWISHNNNAVVKNIFFVIHQYTDVDIFYINISIWIWLYIEKVWHWYCVTSLRCKLSAESQTRELTQIKYIFASQISVKSQNETNRSLAISRNRGFCYVLKCKV